MENQMKALLGMINDIYFYIDRHKEDDFSEIVKTAIFKSMEKVNGPLRCEDEDDLKAVAEIETMAKAVAINLKYIDGLPQMGEREVKRIILGSFPTSAASFS